MDLNSSNKLMTIFSFEKFYKDTMEIFKIDSLIYKQIHKEKEGRMEERRQGRTEEA